MKIKSDEYNLRSYFFIGFVVYFGEGVQEG